MRHGLGAAVALGFTASCGSTTASTSCPAGRPTCLGVCCQAGQSCVSGVCTLICPSSATACSGVCVDTQTDRANCGGCGVTCPAGGLCAGGACCNGSSTVCGSACVDTQTDPVNCGSCGMSCLSGQVCVGGGCTPTCSLHLTACNGTCVNTQTDNTNCGGCGAGCHGEPCVGGACGSRCPSGLTPCASGCANTQTDNDNCGSCDNLCAAGHHCKGGACVVICPSGTTDCSDVCVDTQTDSANCGGCGMSCPSGEPCDGGACQKGSLGGCSDGTREGFVDRTTFPGIAGCEGAWSVAGLAAPSSCKLKSGNSSNNTGGQGCAAADLCSSDFHICASPSEVAANLPSGQTCNAATNSPNVFFAIAQSGPGCALCTVNNACNFPASCSSCQGLGVCENDLFGCGTMGNVPDATCGVLNQTSGNDCSALSTGGWSCNSSDGCTEFAVVTKSDGLSGGGVLCCKN
jgi:hypothetical protein